MSRTSAIERAHREFGGLTSSMAATVAGVNPWDSPYHLYARLTGEEPPLEQTWEMWLGQQMEPVIVRAFTRQTKMRVRRPRRVFDRDFWFTTEEYGFPMGALLDGITVDSSGNAVVEAKHASVFMSDEWGEEPPLMYWFQVQHQLACTGWLNAYVAALVGKKLVWMRVARDDELIAMLTDREREFWQNHIVPRVPPPIDGHAATSAVIRRRYAHSEPGFSVIIEDEEVERLCARYRSEGDSIEALKKQREGTKNQLLVVLDTVESAVVGAYKVTAKEQTRSEIDVERLREEEPEIAAKYTKTSSNRPLRVTQRKGT